MKSLKSLMFPVGLVFCITLEMLLTVTTSSLAQSFFLCFQWAALKFPA